MKDSIAEFCRMLAGSRNSGFSLTEVLMAAGILAIGFMLVAGTFPVGIKLTAIATERTIGTIAANEAFAKIKLYGVNPAKLDADNMMIFSEYLLVDETYVMIYQQFFDPSTWPPGDMSALLAKVKEILDEERLYPSTDISPEKKRYHWSALCKWTDPNEVAVQTTVFVSRKTGAGEKYHEPDGETDGVWPVPIEVAVTQTDLRTLSIVNALQYSFINSGSTIVDNAAGKIYRVMDRDVSDVLLDKDWDSPVPPTTVWVVPPADGSSRYPCVGVYQQAIGL